MVRCLVYHKKQLKFQDQCILKPIQIWSQLINKKTFFINFENLKNEFKAEGKAEGERNIS